MRVTQAEDLADIPGYKRATFEDGSTQIAPASAVDGLMGQQNIGDKLSIFNSGATAQSDPALYSQDPGFAAQRPQTTMPQQVADATTVQQQAPMQQSQPQPDQYTQLVARGLQPRWVGGSAAYDPEKDDASRRAVRTGMTEQVTGAQKIDWDALQKAQDNQRKAQQIQADTAVKMAEYENSVANVNELESRFAYEEAADKQRKAEEAHARKWANIEAESQALADKKIDPKRYVKDMSSWNKALFVLGAAMNGYATQGQGFGQYMGILQRSIQDDIDAQQADLENSRGAVNNALAQKAREFGSIEDGRAALEATRLRHAQAQAKKMAAQIGVPAAMQAADAMSAELEARILEKQAQLKAAEYGTVNRTTQAAMVAPRAAQSGYLRAPTFDETMSVLSKVEDLRSKGMANEAKSMEMQFQQQTGMTPEQFAKRGETVSKDVQEYGKRFDAIASGTSAIDKIVAENDIKTNEKGDLVAPSDIAGFGRIGQSLPNAMVTDKGAANRAALNSIVAAVATKRFGAYNPQQGEAIRDEIIGDGSARTITTNLGIIKRELDSARENMKASFDPAVHAKYKQNLGDARAKEKTTTEGFKPIEGL